MTFKCITATEIEEWSNLEPRRAQELLPNLIIKLILCSTNSIEEFNFPLGKAVQYAGYDGILKCSEQTNFFPIGQSVWEFGTDKDIQKKFNEDLQKRTDEPLHIFKSETTFIFVSSRIWYHRKSIPEVISKSKELTDWKDIKIIDANYLELWLENCPTVSIWLAKILGKEIGGYSTIEDYWVEKTSNTNPILNLEFFLQGRNDAYDAFLKWYKSDNKNLLIRGDSIMEVLLVLSAIVLQAEKDETTTIIRDMIVVEDEESWNKLVKYVNIDTVVIPNFNFTSNIRFPNNCRCILPMNSHSLISMYNKNILCVDVPKQRKKDFIIAMRKVGFNQEDVSIYEMKTKRSFIALYRQITTIPAWRNPEWFKNGDISELLPALFVGGWNEKKDGDRALIEALSNCTYSDYESKLVKWITIEDPPIIKIDNDYMVVSVSDMWNLLWDCITTGAFEKLLAQIPEIFRAKDPTYELDEDQWFAAEMYGKKHTYSGRLLEGIIITMIMLSDRSDIPNLFSTNFLKKAVDNVVRIFLDNVIVWQEWYTIVKFLPLLVEASPESVLSKLEKKSKLSNDDFWKIFNQPKDVIMGRTFHIYIIWALEKLFWEPDYVIRAINVLVTFEEKKIDYQIVNTPVNSLFHVFCLWRPQTCLTLELRMKALKNIVEKHSHTGWKLLNLLIPNGHQVVSGISKPKWRDVDVQVNELTSDLIYLDSTQTVINICLKYITPDLDQWSIVFAHISVFLNRISEVSIKCVEHFKCQTLENRLGICDIIGTLVSNHRKHPDAKWSISEENIIILEKLYYDVLPICVSRYRYLFNYNPYDLNPIPYNKNCPNHEERRQRLFEKRRCAIVEIINKYGIEDVYEIICYATDTTDLGVIISTEILKNKIDWDLVFKIGELNSKVLPSMILELYKKNGLSQICETLNEILDDQVGYIFCYFPQVEEVLNHISKLPVLSQKVYWENVRIYGLPRENNSETEYIIDNLLQQNRAYSLIEELAFSDYKNSEFIIRILEKALEMYPSTEKKGMAFSHIQAHDIEELFEKLYNDELLDRDKVARLELAYLPIFNHDFDLKCILYQLGNDPQMFVDLLILAYQKDSEDCQEITDNMRLKASRAYDILDRFKLIPGFNSENNTIEGDLFKTWLEQVILISKECGYTNASDAQIGRLLSYSPTGEDDIWPHQLVREFLEENCSESLTFHFIIGKRNQRGMHDVTGGDDEKKLATRYHENADKLMYEYPRVASMIREIADSYLDDAKREFHRELKDFR